MGFGVFNTINIADWGLPKIIIFDCDRKFLSELWQTIFTRLKMKTLFYTAYHPQSNGQNEKTNQTIEIVFRYFISTLKNPTNWPDVLNNFQNILNNSISAAIIKTPNKICYNFTAVRPAYLVLQNKLFSIKNFILLILI